VLLLAVFIDRSPLRRELIAARDNSVVAKTLAVPVRRLQLIFFVLGEITGAFAGWMIAHWSSVIGTSSFSIDLSIGLFLMVVLGGLKSHWGPVLGALFYVEVPQVLKSTTKYQAVIYGAVLLVVIVVLPKGIAGIAESARDRWRPDGSRSGGSDDARKRFARLIDFGQR
jgi:branched-chain amino acid transport system permease protein